MRLPEACAVCGGVGSLAPYRDIARAYGWPDSQAHLDCVRYSVATVPLRSRSSFCPRGHRLIQSTDECYTVRQAKHLLELCGFIGTEAQLELGPGDLLRIAGDVPERQHGDRNSPLLRRRQHNG